jgi:hypothetical protein
MMAPFLSRTESTQQTSRVMAAMSVVFLPRFLGTLP